MNTRLSDRRERRSHFAQTFFKSLFYVGFFGEKPGFEAGEGSEKGLFPHAAFIFMRCALCLKG